MAITANQKVLTLDYWKPASKLEVGDIVFNQLGDPVRITLVQHYHSQNCYEVTFNDHLGVEGDARLTFPTENRNYRDKTYKYKGRFKFRRQLIPVAVEKLKDMPIVNISNKQKLSVPTAKPINLPHQDLPVPPFVFGYWFFNRKSHGAMTIFNLHHDYTIEKFKDCGYMPRIGTKFLDISKAMRVTPLIDRQLAPNIPIKIPNNYLLASKEQRLELLRGIIISKLRQYNKSSNNFRISNVNYAIIRQIQFLVESIGCRTRLAYCNTKHYYTCYFKSHTNLIPTQKPSKQKITLGRRYFAKITPTAPQMCVYIETEGEPNPILVGEGLIPCH